LAGQGPRGDKGVIYLAKIALIAGAYYGSAKVGLDLAFATKSVTAVWPPTGIALAALVIWGRSYWPGVALGAFFANMWTGVPLITVLGITAGNTLEALVGAYLLSWVADFRPSLERLRDVFALVVLAGIVSTAIAATVGVLSLIVGDEVSFDDFGSVWRVWWLGDMGGDLLVAPVLMVLAARWPFRGLPGNPVEAIALAASLVGLSFFVFHQETSFAYLTFPLLIWAALRFWQPGATIAVLVVAGLAVYFTAHGHGPYVRDDADDSLLLAQTFFGVASITMMSLAAVITERARAEETVKYIAGALQEGLLPPSLPEIPGIDLAARFRPVGEEYRVGGDFYDVFESRPGRWVVVVGDVSGKGPNAAAVTGLARHTLRTAAVHDDSPSQVLNVLNGALRERLSPREVCTVVYARLEPTDGGFDVTVSSGGHPLPLLMRGDGTVREIGAHGLVLGASPELELAESTVSLAPGDCLLLYTDGLTEAYAPAYTSVRPDIHSLLQANLGSNANEIAEDVYRRMLDFGPSEPRDDVALVVVRIGGEAVADSPDRVGRVEVESGR
jgi:integral membrane sensor domain MASE1/serine phosphatase RsbU (regulator of sigma subunit)